MITSAQNPKLKFIRALGNNSKERRKEGAFIAEGVRLVEESVAAKWPIRLILYSSNLNERGQRLINGLKSASFEVDEVKPNLLQSVGKTEASQGIIAVLNNSPLPIPDTLTFLLILDQIRDPGNLGTLLRTAYAAGVQSVLLTPNTTDAFAPKVVRAGMGAHFRLPIHSMDWNDIKHICKSANLQVFLADMGNPPYWEKNFKDPLAMILGGETDGTSQFAQSLANTTVSVPMIGETESLNVSIAGAVLLFEVVKQRN